MAYLAFLLNSLLALNPAPLGHRDFRAREAAQARLEAAWPLSGPFLALGTLSRDAETTARCRRGVERHWPGMRFADCLQNPRVVWLLTVEFRPTYEELAVLGDGRDFEDVVRLALLLDVADDDWPGCKSVATLADFVCCRARAKREGRDILRGCWYPPPFWNPDPKAYDWGPMPKGR